MPVEGVTSSTPPISKTTAFTAMGAFSSVLTASLRAPSQGGPSPSGKVKNAAWGGQLHRAAGSVVKLNRPARCRPCPDPRAVRGRAGGGARKWGGRGEEHKSR